ncbi:MAG: hypothetical protein ACYDEY_15065 [Acidimicrobiales bacterium]
MPERDHVGVHAASRSAWVIGLPILDAFVASVADPGSFGIPWNH